MAECELLPRCSFLHQDMSYMPATKQMMETNYCRGDKTQCARYMVFEALGETNIPSDLFPNQPDKARKIISKHGR